MRDKHSAAKRLPMPETDLSDLGFWIEVWYLVIQVENCRKEKIVFCGFVVLLCLASNHTQVAPCLSLSKQRSLQQREDLKAKCSTCFRVKLLLFVFSFFFFNHEGVTKVTNWESLYDSPIRASSIFNSEGSLIIVSEVSLFWRQGLRVQDSLQHHSLASPKSGVVFASTPALPPPPPVYYKIKDLAMLPQLVSNS